jgi:transposase
VDGSRFKAVNTRAKNYTPGAIRRRMEQMDAGISRYLATLDTADRQKDPGSCATGCSVERASGGLRGQMRQLQAIIKKSPEYLQALVHAI